MKPMIKYRGGKSKEIPRIMNYVPHFSGRYIEPFFGGGALFFHLEPKRAIINDINKKLIEFYRGVRDSYDEFQKELCEVASIYARNRKEFDDLKALNPDERVDDKNEAMYYELRDMYNEIAEKKYSDALLYYYINKTAYSGMIRYNAKGEFNVPFGRYPNLNIDKVTRQHRDLLQRAEIYNTDYSDIFSLCKEDDFVFLDPPYDCVFSDYGNAEYKDGFNEENHRRLAKDFANLPCKALMVIGKTPLTEELYGDYIVDEYDKNYAVNIRNRFKAEAKHIVVANYETKWDIRLYESENELFDIENETCLANMTLFEPTESYGENR